MNMLTGAGLDAGEGAGALSLTNASAVAPAFRAMRTGRVDLVGVGDSNQIKGGTGWDHGWQYALSRRLPMYATGLLYASDNEGNGSGGGYFYNTLNTTNSPVKAPSAAATGTAAITSGSAVVTGTGTTFTSQLAANQTIQVGGGNFGRVLSVDSDTQATCAQTFTATATGQTLTYYPLPPSQLFQYADAGSGSDGGLFPQNYGHVASGTSTASCGLLVSPGGPVDVTSNLIFSFRSGTFTTGSGSFKPGVRLGSSPFTALQMASLVSTNTGAYGLARTDVQVAADATRSAAPLEARFVVPGQTGITGPWFGTWFRCSDPAKTSGFAYTTLDFRGGKSLRRMALDLQQANPALLADCFGELRRLQGATKYVVFTINSGVNDLNETLASVGPNPATPGSGAAAFADNAQAVINAVNAAWAANGWPASEPYFVLMPTPPISSPDSASLVAYRAAAAGLCASNPRTASVDLGVLTSGAEMAANGWYLSGGDHNHLSQAGYEALGGRAADALLAA